MDRLSALPDSVIHRIFWFLPMDDVVRTLTLSKLWGNRWSKSPFLNFENHTTQILETDNFRNFVYWALASWNGEKIEKFKFESSIELQKSIHAAIDSCVRFALRHQVEELSIHMLLESLTYGGYDPMDGVYPVPELLYSSSCSSLKELSFKHCKFRITQNVQWNQLKRLTITQGLGFTEYVVEKILSGSPQLEVLNLSFYASVKKMRIHSKSLKELSIYQYLFDHNDLSPDSELSGWTPNLKKLTIAGIPYSKCSLMVSESLTHVTIGFSCLHSIDLYDGDFDWEDWDEYVSGLDFVADKFNQVLQTFQLVDNVTLFCGCIKVLGALKEMSTHSSFRNVTSLKIGCCYNDYEQLIDLLKIFPQLKWLVLQHDREDHYQDKQKSLKFDAKSYMNLPSSFLLQLRTVDVTWAEGDNIFPFIEVLFTYASKLENIVFRAGKKEPPVQKLQRIRRSSPVAELIFCKF